MAIAGAIGLALIVALLAYRRDLVSGIWSGQHLQPVRTADEQAKLAATECDRLAASPVDGNRPSGVTGVDFAKIDATAAASSCNNAMRLNPEIARFVFQAGRAADAGEDYTTAMKLYRTASEKGSVAAQNAIGTLYEQGQGIPQDYVEARKWYEKAAGLGDRNSMFNLGVLYEKGRGVHQDLKQARKWYQKSMDIGDPDAEAALKRLK
jgi:TPR repeat protein